MDLHGFSFAKVIVCDISALSCSVGIRVLTIRHSGCLKLWVSKQYFLICTFYVLDHGSCQSAFFNFGSELPDFNSSYLPLPQCHR